LYLVCACLHGDSQALRHLEALCRSELRFALRRLKTEVDEDEVTSTLLAKLLVAETGSEPKLRLYAGRSELRRWLQVVIACHVLKERRWQQRSEAHREAFLAGMVFPGIPGLREMDTATRQSFKEALGKAFESLAPRDRYLLQLRLDGLNTVAIAAFFDVQRSTVARWLVRVNVAVEHAVRRELRDRLRLANRDLDSLVRSVLSRVDTSIRIEVSRACGGGSG
jgi:RNA polymerase sigma-70 factor